MRRARDPNCDRSGGESPTSGSTSEKFDAVTTGGESHWGPNEVREVTAAENTQTGFAPLHELDLASRPLLNPPSPLLRSTVALLQTYNSCNHSFLYTHEHVPRRCLTKPQVGMFNNALDNENRDLILFVNSFIRDYVVVDLLGTGTFGQVVECRHLGTGQTVAIKVIKNQPAYFQQAWMEIYMLRRIHDCHGERAVNLVVRLFDHFVFHNHLCLVFEKLGINLFELVQQNGYRGLDLGFIRRVTRQLLVVLRILADCDIIHCDLKPENILLRNRNSVDVKLIDFGSACQESHVGYTYVQSRFYRAPEVLLGSQYTSKIDLWSLGCIAGELYLGLPLFPGACEHDMVTRIFEMIGPPSDGMLERCRNSTKYFWMDEHGSSGSKYNLKSDEEYAIENSSSIQNWKRYFGRRSLREIIMHDLRRTEAPTPNNMKECFADFLLGLLQIDPNDRWDAEQASRHPFVAEPHLFTEVSIARSDDVPSYDQATDSRRSPVTPIRSSPLSSGGLIRSRSETAAWTVTLDPLLRARLEDQSQNLSLPKFKFGSFSSPSPPTG